MVLTPHPSAPDNHKVIPLWINGSAYPFSNNDTLFPITSSLSNKPLHYAISSTAETASKACDAAATAFKTWRSTTPLHRRSLLLKAADIIEARSQALAASQIAETSCPQRFADKNVQLGISTLREVAAATSEI
ncbi:unnamed protein product [Periconia digitata]|uniref:Aldehyde dehydrogenase domain-containing protein n=1 Tax=Periconia digitata TaxID=1303443 RepID=A0A9W4XGS7_9PLEO|nr:unnamed protein product [Periconia digitata]